MSNSNVEKIFDEVREKFFQESEVMLYCNFGAVNVLPVVQDYKVEEQKYSYLVVTNSRLILYEPSSLFGTSGIKYIPLNRIQSVTLIEQWLDRTHLEIITPNEVLKVRALDIEDLWHTDRKALLMKLLRAIDDAQRDFRKTSIKSEDSVETKYSNLELLKKLEELYRAGILNQAEYEEKKREILKKI